MYKIKVGLINILGCASAGAIMQVLWVALSGESDQLDLWSIFNMMCISAVIGTICLFALFYLTLKNTGGLIRVIVTNNLLVIVLCIAVYLETGLVYSYWGFDAKWAVILAIALTVSSVLSTFWYSRIKLYKDKLESKRASLRKQ